MLNAVKRGALAAAATLTLASVAGAQGRPLEMGLDAGAVFGLGDQSSVDITLPASRARLGFFLTDTRWSIEPALGLSYTKVEDTDGIFTYDVELGALYHLRPFVVATADESEVIARVNAPYVRPFIGFTGFTGGDTDDNEFSIGTGLGIKIPWRRQIAWRLEANAGYGFSNDAFRLGALAGFSFFTR